MTARTRILKSILPDGAQMRYPQTNTRTSIYPKVQMHIRMHEHVHFNVSGWPWSLTMHLWTLVPADTQAGSGFRLV